VASFQWHFVAAIVGPPMIFVVESSMIAFLSLHGDRGAPMSEPHPYSEHEIALIRRGTWSRDEATAELLADDGMSSDRWLATLDLARARIAELETRMLAGDKAVSVLHDLVAKLDPEARDAAHAAAWKAHEALREPR